MGIEKVAGSTPTMVCARPPRTIWREVAFGSAPSLLRQARTRIIEQHYTQGVRFYREEKLKEAIAEWRVVLEMDPSNANARRNIDQAEKLLRGLEQRMKK